MTITQSCSFFFFLRISIFLLSSSIRTRKPKVPGYRIGLCWRATRAVLWCKDQRPLESSGAWCLKGLVSLPPGTWLLSDLCYKAKNSVRSQETHEC